MSPAHLTACDPLLERAACSVTRTRIGCKSRRLYRTHAAPAMLVITRRGKVLHAVSRFRPADKRFTFRSISRFSLGSRICVRRKP